MKWSGINQEGLDWDLQPWISASSNKAEVSRSLDEIIARVVNEAGEGDAVGDHVQWWFWWITPKVGLQVCRNF